MLKDKALQSQATEKHCNNQHAISFSMTERLIELVGLKKAMPKNNKGKIIFARNWTETAEKRPYIALFCTETEYLDLNIKSIYKYR